MHLLEFEISTSFFLSRDLLSFHICVWNCLLFWFDVNINSISDQGDFQVSTCSWKYVSLNKVYSWKYAWLYKSENFLIKFALIYLLRYWMLIDCRLIYPKSNSNKMFIFCLFRFINRNLILFAELNPPLCCFLSNLTL